MIAIVQTDCNYCYGSGTLRCSNVPFRYSLTNRMAETVPCFKCKGTGRITTSQKIVIRDTKITIQEI